MNPHLRVDGKYGLELSNSACAVALCVKHEPKVAVRIRVIGIDGDGRVVHCDSACIVAQLVECDTKVAVRICMVEFDRDG